MDLHMLATAAGLDPDRIIPAGRHRATIDLRALTPPPDTGTYVLVTAVTPTPAGEGKTVTTIGLAMGLAQRGQRTLATLRQSSLGPTFGRKGGGAGGGAAAVTPLQAGLLGGLADLAAVESAHNLLAAAADDALHRGRFGLTANRVTWRRVLDVNDRALRDIVVGLGGTVNGTPRQTGFDITAASEVMAVLTLASDLADLRARLGRIVIGTTPDDEPVTAEDLGVAGAMAALLRDAAEPNLLASSEGTPILIHAGPFGNLSVGTCSVISDRIALNAADVTVTEAGFGADLGAEKFLHLKVPQVGRASDVVVLVTTVRAMRWHGGATAATLDQPDAAAVARGTVNLTHHVQRLAGRGLPVVVAINLHGDETAEELEVTTRAALEAGAVSAVPHSAYRDGGKGALELADAVMAAPRGRFTPLVAAGTDVRTGIEIRAREWYGADGVDWDPKAEKTLAWLERSGYGNLPVCIAKTHLSVSHDQTLLGAPTGFRFPIRELRLAAGGGYVTALAGDILTMPGLPDHPRYHEIDLDEDGEVIGLV
jgi:formate--tetrahydrofolate ligase